MTAKWTSFRENDSGQLSVIFSLVALSLVTMVGVSLDYARTERERVLVTAAADAATLAAVKQATEKPTLVAGNAVTIDVGATKQAAKTTAEKTSPPISPPMAARAPSRRR